MKYRMPNTQYLNPAPLRRSARRFHAGFRIAAWAMAAAGAALLAAMLLRPSVVGDALAGLTGHAFAPRPWQLATLTALMLGTLGLYGAVFAAAARVCRVLLDGRPEAAGPTARGLSRWLWALLAWSVLSPTLSVLIATAHAAEHSLTITLGMPQVAFAVAALIAAFLARALTFAAALWRDHREIV